MYMWSFMGGGSGWKGGVEGRGERVQVGRAGWAGLHHSPPHSKVRLLHSSSPTYEQLLDSPVGNIVPVHGTAISIVAAITHLASAPFLPCHPLWIRHVEAKCISMSKGVRRPQFVKLAPNVLITSVQHHPSQRPIKDYTSSTIPLSPHRHAFVGNSYPTAHRFATARIGTVGSHAPIENASFDLRGYRPVMA